MTTTTPRLQRALVLLALVALLAAACGDSTSAESADRGATTTTGAETTTSTSTVTPSTTTTSVVVPGERSVWPWHAAGSAHADPADAVREFAEFIGFGEGFALGEFQQGDSRSGEIEILPVLALADEGPSVTIPQGFGAWWPTTAFVRLDGDDRWEVIGAVSGGVVVDQPIPEATVFSPLNVAFTHRAVSDGVRMELWPDGVSEPLVEQDLNPMGSGIFTTGDHQAAIRWESDTDGPATAIFRSAWGGDPGVIAVTTVRVDLDPSASVSDAATILGPVGDRRLGVLYQQPDVRLSIHEPGECGDRPRPVIVTGAEPFPTFRDGFTGRGYVVVEAALRSPGSTGSLSDSMLVALDHSVHDLAVAVQWLRAHADGLCIDPDRIAAAGNAFTAITSLSLAYTYGELNEGDTLTIEGLPGSAVVPEPLPGPPEELAVYSNDVAAVVSIAGFALPETIDPGEPPALLINGRADPVVPFALAEQTCSAATAVGITCELLPHDQGHMLPTDDLTATWDHIDEFLRRELQIPS